MLYKRSWFFFTLKQSNKSKDGFCGGCTSTLLFSVFALAMDLADAFSFRFAITTSVKVTIVNNLEIILLNYSQKYNITRVNYDNII